jgi:hypothetical protein
LPRSSLGPVYDCSAATSWSVGSSRISCVTKLDCPPVQPLSSMKSHSSSMSYSHSKTFSRISCVTTFDCPRRPRHRTPSPPHKRHTAAGFGRAASGPHGRPPSPSPASDGAASVARRAGGRRVDRALRRQEATSASFDPRPRCRRRPRSRGESANMPRVTPAGFGPRGASRRMTRRLRLRSGPLRSRLVITDMVIAEMVIADMWLLRWPECSRFGVSPNAVGPAGRGCRGP